MIINFSEELLEVYTPDVVVPTRMAKMNKKTIAVMTSIRTALGEAQGIAEELIPLEKLREFYKVHLDHLLLPLYCPEAVIYRDVLPWHLVAAYRDTFAGEVCLGPATRASSTRHVASMSAALKWRTIVIVSPSRSRARSPAMSPHMPRSSANKITWV